MQVYFEAVLVTVGWVGVSFSRPFHAGKKGGTQFLLL